VAVRAEAKCLRARNRALSKAFGAGSQPFAGRKLARSDAFRSERVRLQRRASPG